MNSTTAKLTGVGEVRGPDGTLKATFTIETDCTREQAERLAADLNATLEDNTNGNHARSQR